MAQITMRPHHLMCLHCLKGGGAPPDCACAGLEQKLEQIEADRNTLITLETAFDCMGGPDTFPGKYDPATRRKDLQVLRALNLVPGATRSAYWLIGLWLPKLLPTLEGICRLGGTSGPGWEECPVAGSDAYEKGMEAGIIASRSMKEMQQAKAESCAEIETTDRLRIRAHHLLCIMCFYGRELEEPLAEDNLWEALVKIRENPDVEIELIEGACMICPPCTIYDPQRGICDGLCSLRDRLKDLNTFWKLGLQPGDVLTAREVYDLIFERIGDIREICGNPGNLIPEWADCGGCTDERYEKALARGKFYE